MVGLLGKQAKSTIVKINTASSIVPDNTTSLTPEQELQQDRRKWFLILAGVTVATIYFLNK